MVKGTTRKSGYSGSFLRDILILYSSPSLIVVPIHNLLIRLGLLVLGLATSIKPITISMFALFDIAFMVLITILLYLFMKKNNSLVRKQGIILVAIYTCVKYYANLTYPNEP